MVVYAQPEITGGFNNRHHGDLYVADVGGIGSAPRPIALLHDAGGQARYPVFSPDGEWIAFHGDDHHVYVIPATGGAATRVSAKPGARLEMSWLPSLSLP
jgi:Tol biopolymer transport system component